MNNSSLIWGLIIGLIIGIFIGWKVLPSKTAVVAQMNQSNTSSSGSKAERLRDDMRKLWEDHITWTRLYIVEAAADSAAADPTLQRLMKNQEDIGNAISAYYGADNGKKLTDLLKQHIAQAGDLLKAAKAGDNAGVEKANKDWFDNASQIADFLSSANPNWPKQTVLDMMNQHLNLTKQEAVDRLHKDYSADIADYDKVHDEILMMADALSDGIIKQFPDKFN